MENNLFTIDPDKEFEATLSALEDMPKSRRVVSAIRNELKAKQQSILERYELIKGNGKSDEDNAAELMELQREVKQAEEKALEAVKVVQISTILKLNDQVAEMEEKRDGLEKQRDKRIKEICVENMKTNTEKMVKIYPNDPCPCGSGKKYKKCCGR